MNAKKTKNGFRTNNPILFNFIIIILTGIVLVYAGLTLIDIFTEHGKYKEVPNIKNMPIRQAIDVLEQNGFKWSITDSIYDDKHQPGSVIEQNPKAFTKVKSNRTIYISMNAISPKLISFPNVTEVSERQGRAILEGLGFGNIQIESTPSPFQDLIIGAKINGLPINVGQKVPTSSHITLVVGNGEETITSVDSLTKGDNPAIEPTDQSGENSGGVDFMQ